MKNNRRRFKRQHKDYKNENFERSKNKTCIKEE